jgi:PucR C-terminal helix-turn-helix domain/GGDEF-like domain
VPLEELAAALGRTVVRCVRLPEPHATVRGVVLHTAGDPAPDRDLLVLCAAPEAGPPDCAGIVVRESAVEATLGRVSAATAVFAASDSERWSDVYDRVQWAVGESFGQLAEHDAFHLADALATAVGGAVAIEDARRRVVAFSAVPGQPIDEVRQQGILGRQVPEHVERERWYAKLWRSTGSCEFTDGTESTARLAVPVRAGAEPLGSIWAIGDRATLNPGADDILERSVDVVAACLAHQDHFAARSREARTQVLRRLLGPDAGAAGFALPGPTVLVALAGEGDADDRRLTDTRLADVLSLKAHRFQGSGVAAALDGRVYALLPATDRGRLETYLRDVVSRTAPRVGCVAVSDPVERVQELAAARRRVDRLLTLRRRDGLEIMHAGRERDRLALAELAEAVRGVEALRDGMMSRIGRHDREHGTAYLPTLRAWFETSGDVPAAAARLHVHPNTFRYRMARAGDLFGLRLDQPDERLLLHLQLRLSELD